VGCESAGRCVAKARNPEIVKRNDMMYAEWRRGASITSVAAANGLARQVVARIIAALHPEEEEDTDRAVFRGELWRLYDEIGDLYRNPGYKMAPTGSPARGPDDEPALDTNVMVQAGELRLKTLRELRILDARDRPAQQNVKYSVEYYVQQKDESLAALAAKKAADDARIRELEARVSGSPPTVPGEVIAELPPSDGSGGGRRQEDYGG